MPIENLDYYFAIARQHTACEDYAIAGTSPIPYIIVCDGCSTSPMTDIGARILAASAKKSLQEYFAADHTGLPSYGDFGYTTINRARHIIDLLGLESTCLDATLLAAIPYHNEIHVYVYGDGYIITVNTQHELSYIQLSYIQNMPYYLTYWIDKGRRDLYLQANQEGKDAMTVLAQRGKQEEVRKMNSDTPLVFMFGMNEYLYVALASDGVSSFFAAEENKKIAVREILTQIVSYKTTKGDFVKRRAKRMFKEYEKQGIYPTDDVSIATLLIGD
jgi:serine/threonine protein phosphatase PrpC